MDLQKVEREHARKEANFNKNKNTLSLPYAKLNELAYEADVRYLHTNQSAYIKGVQDTEKRLLPFIAHC